MMKLGIVQGRLLPPVDGHIQEFPMDGWKKEFDLLYKTGLNHIEWIITKKSYYSNPIFSERLSSYKISSICCDHLIDNKIQEYSFIDENLFMVCESAQKNNIHNISIPLLEDSNMESDTRRREFVESILRFKRNFPDINFIFETELSPQKTLDIVNKDEKFFVTYDTGNVTSYLREHEEYVKTLSHKIVNVHLKDRTYEPKTVLPFSGNTNFYLIFKLLKEVGYTSLYTLQIARGQTGQEVEYIIHYKKLFEELHDKVFV